MVNVRERVSLRILLWSLLAFSITAWLATGALLGVITFRVNADEGRVSGILEPSAEAAATLHVANSDMQRGLSLYVIDPAPERLAIYFNGERRSQLALDELENLLGDDPEIGPLIEADRRARRAWLQHVSQPAVKDVRDDRPGEAEAIATGARSQELWDDLDTSTAELVVRIDQDRSDGFQSVRDLTNSLSWALMVALGLFSLSIAMTTVLMFRWVLAPLDDLRRQLRDLARRGNHDRPIEPTGPTELAVVAKDAERMRQQLIREIDEARGARQALEHRAPVITEIRRELSSQQTPDPDGLVVHGRVVPAEGVLAGDWWDCLTLPGGSIAFVVSDVSGHGPVAGIAAMRVKHILGQALSAGAEPQVALTAAARPFAEDSDRFVTVAIVIVDPATGTVRWANGGHNPPLVLRSDGRVKKLAPTGPLLSWLGGPWHADATSMGERDLLICYSDGLVESHDAAGEQLALAGLIDLLRVAAARSRDPADIVNHTLATARARAIDWDRDDVTLVVAALTTTARDQAATKL